MKNQSIFNFFFYLVLILGPLSLNGENKALKYGDRYYIKNLYKDGSYLDACGLAKCGNGTKYQVIAHTLPNRDGYKTGTWIILSATGKRQGTPVLIGDVVYLKNVHNEGTYLDTCGGGSCTKGTKYNVTTNTQPNRANQKTGHWQIVSATGIANGTQLSTDQPIHLKNLYKGGSYLDTCGAGSCGTGTKYSVTTNTSSNRAGLKTGHWSFQATTGGVAIKEKEKSIALNNIKSLIEGLNPTHHEFKVKGTYSVKHLFTTYSAGIQHVQGVAYHNGRWYFTHNARDGKSESLIVVSNTSTGKSNFFLEGKYNHPGAIQNCNAILAVSMEHGNHSEVMFYNLTNPDSPVLLPTKIARNKKAGAVGIAYHHKEKCHYVMVEYGPGPEHFDLYKSNGLSLLSNQCRFTLVGTDVDIKNCQGGTQLLYEGNTGKLYLGGLYRDGGWEKIYLAEVNTSTGKLTESTIKKLSNSTTSTDFQAGFRWGGCFVPKNANNLEVYGVARTLTYGPAQNYTKVKKWSRKKYVKIYNTGIYVAKFTLTYTSGGQRKTKTGSLAAGQWKNYTTAWDTSDFHLKANAVGGREILNRKITANKCYRLKGTTLFNGFDNNCN